MKLRSTLAALAILAVLCVIAVKTVPEPLAWYDLVILVLLAFVPALLVILMSVDTERWDVPGFGFAVAFTGGALLYARFVLAVYRRPWLQSHETLWMIRAVLMAGYLLLLISFVDQAVSRKRSVTGSIVRLSVLTAAIAAIAGATWVIQRVDWRGVWQ